MDKQQHLVAKAVTIPAGWKFSEVHQGLLFGIGGQSVRQSDQNADGQRRDESQHKEHNLIMWCNIYIVWYVLWSLCVCPWSSDYLVPNGQSVLVGFRTALLHQRTIVGARHHGIQISSSTLLTLGASMVRLSACLFMGFVYFLLNWQLVRRSNVTLNLNMIRFHFI